jgi:hypothetical protein
VTVRYIALLWFHDGTPPEKIDELTHAISGLRAAVDQPPGSAITSCRLRRGLGIRDDAADAALEATFTSAQAYLHYDAHPLHDRIRTTIAAQVVRRMERAVVALDEPADGPSGLECGGAR